MSVVAQQTQKCGFNKTIQSAVAVNPALENVLSEVRAGTYHETRAAAKTSVSTENPTIPVVFHIVLTEAQIIAMGDTAEIKKRIAAQMDVINRDFNAQNADSSAIPDGFKGLYGNTGIKFGLAHTAPDGSATEGYEIITTNRNGFNLEGGWGSGFGFSGVKYISGGGANAWDVESYLNIWVINPLEKAAPTNILGLAVPQYLTTGNTGVSPVEQGIVIHYLVLGDNSTVTGRYLVGSDLGRTLTHEIGHYFELLHPWGDDEGKCPNNGGDDDGIADTPPQAYPSRGCNSYPLIDGCSRAEPGIMYMNYMDYSDDNCLLMFTHQQVERMRLSMQPTAATYSLTQQPWLLEYPDVNVPIADNKITLYPNPADNVLNISFYKQSVGLQSIHIVDLAGRYIVGKEYEEQSSFFSFNTTALHAGMYFVVFTFDGSTEVHKLLVR